MPVPNFRPAHIQPVLVIVIIMVWLLPCDQISAQSYWDAIFELGYDPFTQQVSNRLACRRINNLYALQVQVSENLEIDPKLQSSIQNLHSRLTSLDAANLYDIMPFGDPAGMWRGVGIRGSSKAQNYQLLMYKPDLSNWPSSSGAINSRPHSPDVKLGDVNLNAFVKPGRENTYRLAADAQMYLDDIPALTVPRMVDGVLNTLWLHANSDIEFSTKVQAIAPLNRPSTSVLIGLARDFPELVRIILTYFSVDSIISSKSDPSDGSVLLEVSVQFIQEAFAKSFPEIAKLLSKLKDSVYFRIRLLDERERLMGVMELDPVDQNFSIWLQIRNGHLLPLTAGTGNRRETSFNFSTPGCKQFYIAYDLHLNVVGLRLNIDSLPIAVDYSNLGRELEIKACLRQPPKFIDAGGWAFGFIPLWLVDALIPSNVEEISTHFFRTLALGNGGEGTLLRLESSGHREMKNYIRLQAGTEVLGNGTIKLAFNLQRKLFARQNALLKELRTFKNLFLAAFYHDYQRMKTVKGCQGW